MKSSGKERPRVVFWQSDAYIKHLICSVNSYCLPSVFRLNSMPLSYTYMPLVYMGDMLLCWEHFDLWFRLLSYAVFVILIIIDRKYNSISYIILHHHPILVGVRESLVWGWDLKPTNDIPIHCFVSRCVVCIIMIAFIQIFSHQHINRMFVVRGKTWTY